MAVIEIDTPLDESGEWRGALGEIPDGMEPDYIIGSHIDSRYSTVEEDMARFELEFPETDVAYPVHVDDKLLVATKHLRVQAGIAQVVKSVLTPQKGELARFARPSASIILPLDGPFAGQFLGEIHIERIDGSRTGAAGPESVHQLRDNYSLFKYAIAHARQSRLSHAA